MSDKELIAEIRADYAETYEGTNERRYARFDRWLAAHDAEVAAKALEEAAVGIFVRPASADAVYDALRARAAKYRKAVQS